MRVGCPAEVKIGERRVGLSPGTVAALVDRGHEVLIESGAGAGAGAADERYEAVGARIVETAEMAWAADLVVKVKEPQPSEWTHLRPDLTLFTYLHLAADRDLSTALAKSGATCIAYEDVTDQAGRLPLLEPMSRVAGRLSIQAGAHALEAHQGGAGVLLGGVPGVPAGHVVVVGAGIVGTNAIEMAVGLGAEVTVLDISPVALARVTDRFGGRVRTAVSDPDTLASAIADADVVVGGVLVPGSAAPKVVSEEMVAAMRPGSVVVDVAIDQGGCVATSKPTTHAEPTFTVHGVVHNCVANLPGAVPKTATLALNSATARHVVALADGPAEALDSDGHLAAGRVIEGGRVVSPGVLAAFPELAA